jgi:hypothetical protein
MKAITIFSFCILFAGLAFGDVINVPGEQTTIQAGINAAANGDTVLVADSTYYENINFKGKAITVASMFIMDQDTSHISNTIINGSKPSHPDSGSVVSFISGEDTTSVLCGFTITAGSGTYIAYVPIIEGGGIFCLNSGAKIIHNHIENNSILSPVWAGSAGIGIGPPENRSWVVISNNRIQQNTTNGKNWVYGAAIEMFANGYISNNIITNNEGNNTNGVHPALVTGVVYFGGDSIGANRNTVHIINNTIANNSVISDITGCHGAGIHGVGSQVFILNNTIRNNVGNGITHGLGGGIDLVRVDTGSVIANNYIGYNILSSQSSRGGGIRVLDCETKIINNLIIGNKADKGGGIYIRRYGKDKIINNTLVDNYASVFGGGLYIDNAHPKIFNTILWDSCAQFIDQEIKIENGGSIEIHYSNIKGNWSGTGNININTSFVDGDTFYNLSDSSPCIGAGIDSCEFGGIWYYAPPYDYDGDPRPMQAYSMPDIGAQENRLSDQNNIEYIDYTNPKKFVLSQNHPNPFNPTTVISYQLPAVSQVELSIYSILGQRVATLVNKKQAAGNHKVQWNASGFASGVYMYRLSAGSGPAAGSGHDFSQIKKLILLK